MAEGHLFVTEIAVEVQAAQYWVHIETFSFGTSAFVMAVRLLHSLECLLHSQARGTVQGATLGTNTQHHLVAVSRDRGTEGFNFVLR